MKIEAGKYYRTRDGEKAMVVGLAPNDNVCPYAVGYVEGRTKWYGWDKDGTVAFSDGDQNLIAEWRDPVKVKVKVFVYRRTACGTLFFEQFDKHTGPDYELIAIKEITEGEGLKAKGE